jgi:hypothetical protein
MSSGCDYIAYDFYLREFGTQNGHVALAATSGDLTQRLVLPTEVVKMFPNKAADRKRKAQRTSLEQRIRASRSRATRSIQM